MEHWGLRLRQALRSRRVRKLHALAVEIGVDQSALSRWRNGLPISLANAVALSRALDVSLDWLVTGRGAMDAHRATPADKIELAALLFGELSSKDASTLRRVLVTLAQAARCRARDA